MVSSLSVGQLVNRQCPNHSLWSPDVSCLSSSENITFNSLKYKFKYRVIIMKKKSDLIPYSPLCYCRTRRRLFFFWGFSLTVVIVNYPGLLVLCNSYSVWKFKTERCVLNFDLLMEGLEAILIYENDLM